MEVNKRRVVHRRKPLSDVTNTFPVGSPKPQKTNRSSCSSSSSSALDKSATESSIVAAATTNLDNVPNPSSPSPPVTTTPSLKTPSLHGDSITPLSIQIVDTEVSDDVEASEPVEPISVTYSRRLFSNKRKKDKGKAVAVPISISNKRKKDKGKAVAVPVSSTPSLKISDSRKNSEKNDEFEGVNVSKTNATFPRTKKQRTLSSEKDWINDYQLQEYIAKQNAYFKEIDEFELEVEYVKSGDELD